MEGLQVETMEDVVGEIDFVPVLFPSVLFRYAWRVSRLQPWKMWWVRLISYFCHEQVLCTILFLCLSI